MIFAVDGHIEMIRNGLLYRVLYNETEPCKAKGIVKTQTRRLNRGIYKVGRSYAVQRKRGVKAEADIRIVMDRIWKETGKVFLVSPSGRKFANATEISITKEDAWEEGGYTSEEYEKEFRELNPKWNGWTRWAFEFHVVEVQKQ